MQPFEILGLCQPKLAGATRRELGGEVHCLQQERTQQQCHDKQGVQGTLTSANVFWSSSCKGKLHANTADLGMQNTLLYSQMIILVKVMESFYYMVNKQIPHGIRRYKKVLQYPSVEYNFPALIYAAQAGDVCH